MSNLIRNGEVVSDRWQILASADTAADPADLPTEGAVLVPLSLWLAHRAAFAARPETGVWLDSHESPAPLAEDLDRLPVVGIRFPKSGDGRGYSMARLLRTRHGYRGELRAFGDLGRDHFDLLVRCGFDALQPPAGRYTLEQLVAATGAVRGWGRA
jgi:uncharacterized protein (DUF934 family)